MPIDPCPVSVKSVQGSYSDTAVWSKNRSFGGEKKNFDCLVSMSWRLFEYLMKQETSDEVPMRLNRMMQKKKNRGLQN